MLDEDEHIPQQGSYTYTTPQQLNDFYNSPPPLANPSTHQQHHQPHSHHNLYQSTTNHPPSTTAASHDPTHSNQTLTDDLLNLDSTPTLSLSIPDLDTFFTAAYSHWKEGGLRGVIGSKVVSLLVLGFSVLFSSFLLLCIDWDVVMRCSHSQHVEYECSAISLVTWRHLDDPNPLTYTVGLYFTLFSLYWLSHLSAFLYSLPTLLFIHSFYRSHLQLDDAAVVGMGWGDVLQRLEAVQERERLCVVKRLNGLDITNRIMRRDNYMIALVNAQLLDVSSPSWSRLWSFGRYETIEERGEEAVNKAQSSSSWMYGTMLDSIVRLCVINCLFSADFRLSPSFTSPNAGRWLQRRFVLFGLLTVVFLPFLFVFFVLLFVLRHAEELHTKKSLSSSRQWSLLSQWRLREYNELPHFFQRRLSLASLHALAYIEQFPAVLTSLFASAIAYCAAAVVGVLLLLGASGGVMAAYVLDRSLWWWLAVFSALLAISRSFIHTPPSVSTTPTSPALTFASLVSYTHYHPRQWRGREHTAAVMRDVAAMYASRLTLFAHELLALLACPVVLLLVLSQRERCEEIVRYVQRVSVEVKGVGVVCQMARFELAADIQEEADADKEAEVDSSNRKQKTDAAQARRDKEKKTRKAVQRGREGKMEKSFLSFVINHQHWKLGQQDDEDSPDTQQHISHDKANTTHGREQFLLSIAEGAKETDTIADQFDERHHQQHYAPQQRRMGRARTTHEQSGSGRQRRRRGTSVDSLDSVSSSESLSASPVRSSRQSVDDENDKYEADEKDTPLQSPSHSIAPHVLSASDRHLLVSFADLLNVATQGNGSAHASHYGGALAGRPWLAPPPLMSTSSLLMQRSTAGLSGQRSMLASQLGGSRVGAKRSAWEERMDEEVKASVTDRAREKMFSVLEKRVEEEEEAEDTNQQQHGRDEEDDTRLDGDVTMAVDVPISVGRRGASEVEMRRILESKQRLPQYHSNEFR